MDRRDFIKLTAITGTSATLASCGHPEHELIRFIPDEDLTPGVAQWKPGVCPSCRAGCGMLVRVMEGDAEVVRGTERGLVKMALAKKLEGNPAHPINEGKLCPRGQAAIQITYHPDRITQPLKRSGARGSGQYQPITWDDAIAELVAELDALAGAGVPRGLAVWTRPGASCRRDLVDVFLARFGAPPASSFELFDDDVLRRANLMSFGRDQLPTFDLARSRYAIVFGADLLGTWNSPVAHSAAYGKMRQGRPGIRGKLVQVEPRMSLTGASADEWVPIRPGTEGVLALGLAHVIITARLRDAAAAGGAGALLDGWSKGLPEYTSEAVERRTGISAARVERLARELVNERPALAIIGGAPLAHTNGLFQALAVNALNALLGSVGEAGGLAFMPQLDSGAADLRGPRPRAVASVAADIVRAERSPVQVLLVDDVNPVFAAPPGWRLREALAKVPFIASFGSFLDETSVFADLILPDHSFLESWSDARPESGASAAVMTMAAPAMRPLHQTRATPDVLLEVSRRLQRPLTPPLPWQNFEEMLRASMAAVAPRAAAADDLWDEAVSQGGWWGEVRSRKVEVRSAKYEGRTGSEPEFDGDVAEYPFHFLPYASQTLFDGSLAHLPWLQELPDPMSTAMWSSWVEVNPQTAARLGVAEGDVVEIASRHGVLRAPALISPGVAPNVIAMPVGQGHERLPDGTALFTRYASGRGSNPIKILAPLVEPETGALAWAATRVRLTRAGGRDGRLILFAGSMTDEVRRER